ncbi:GNAT family N-acetyltransferase [Streptomyces albireticuli]|uniref:N-acetyltransferase n=1 Tax=Streptomyces albireticuli TaxID=1940 RepID=A0A2A2D4P3_9ACTN|nr:GNAT family N-acetyltransferase [Streptomyces albireticuli]MCD9140715.1 GNAT family N-acetyltransferase [Streptomyces albireticuli]MCD9161323.1 GNAT family N-acetyltransferase [Streptomyces albireticuli]MCD9190619.1 GNAT family N-acetyltransferase [Streptomyces albireticuli]PAU46485.1 N-acetyltransferase [Streptomyces albireticuli]
MSYSDRPDVAYRPALPGDFEAIEALDNSFTTGAVLEVTATEEGFRVRAVPVDPPLRKVYPDEEELGEDAEARAFVAYDAGGLCGAVTFAHSAWNSRLLISDVRVAPHRRGQGVGSALMDLALDEGRELGARTAWLEVTSVNAPAVRAYRGMGFALCGLDTTLYTGTASEGEIALFMSRPL